MAQVRVLSMRKHMWKFGNVFMSVSSCSSTLNKCKFRTVKQPLSVLESMYDISVRKWQ